MKLIAIGFAGIVLLVIFFILNPRIIYNFAVALFYTAIKISFLWSAKSRMWLQGRKNVFLDLNNHFYYPDQKKIWVHCASLGEFEQGRPLIEKLRTEYPHYKILLTFFSPSGYEVQKMYSMVDHVAYLPLDTKKNAQKFFDIVQPSVVIFVKYEFWLHFVEVVHRNKKPVYLISALFKKNMIFFKWYGKLFRKLLEKFTHIFVQNDTSFELLKKIKTLQNVSVAYDTRFDRVAEVAAQHQENTVLKVFSNGFNVIVAGSTWPADERRIAAAFYKDLFYNNFKMVIAPHQIDTKHMKKTLKRFKKFSLRYSEANNVDSEKLQTKRILIIDNMGMLSSLYKYAQVCYVGGGFNSGIHNILEAAVYAKPVFFGPNYKKSDEAENLVKLNSAFSIQTSDDLIHEIQFMGNFEKMYTGICETSGKFVRDRCGGTEKILDKMRASL